MKTRSSNLTRFTCVVLLANFMGESRLAAQTAAELSAQICAGLTITGTAGTVYSVEYITDLTQTNNPSAWRCLEDLQLPASPYLWADKSAPATGKRFYRAVAREAPPNMVFIPPGTFRMGSPTNEVDRGDHEGPQTAVIISRGFWMGMFEVTQGEYLELMGNNPSWFNGDRTSEGGADYGNNLARPVERVSWDDAVDYCAALTQRDRQALRIPSNCVYRLPTEAEWEYACRAWTSTRFSYGDDPGYTFYDDETGQFTTVGYTNLTDYAWYGDNSAGQTHTVGQKVPNPWGLYDMHGNVWEWCQDPYGIYPGGTVLDPQGPLQTEPDGRFSALRGGGLEMTDWRMRARSCRSASREIGFAHEFPIVVTGIRVVLSPGPP